MKYSFTLLLFSDVNIFFLSSEYTIFNKLRISSLEHKIYLVTLLKMCGFRWNVDWKNSISIFTLVTTAITHATFSSWATITARLIVWRCALYSIPSTRPKTLVNTFTLVSFWRSFAYLANRNPESMGVTITVRWKV